MIPAWPREKAMREFLYEMRVQWRALPLWFWLWSWFIITFVIPILEWMLGWPLTLTGFAIRAVVAPVGLALGLAWGVAARRRRARVTELQENRIAVWRP